MTQETKDYLAELFEDYTITQLYEDCGTVLRDWTESHVLPRCETLASCFWMDSSYHTYYGHVGRPIREAIRLNYFNDAVGVWMIDDTDHPDYDEDGDTVGVHVDVDYDGEQPVRPATFDEWTEWMDSIYEDSTEDEYGSSTTLWPLVYEWAKGRYSDTYSITRLCLEHGEPDVETWSNLALCVDYETKRGTDRLSVLNKILAAYHHNGDLLDDHLDGLDLELNYHKVDAVRTWGLENCFGTEQVDAFMYDNDTLPYPIFTRSY